MAIGSATVQSDVKSPTVAKFDQLFADREVPVVDYIELGDPGIPHAVVKYPGLQETSLDALTDLAQRIRYWSAFPKGANVNFYDADSAGELVVRTYERGVEGFTYACGTGSGATAYAVARRREQTQANLCAACFRRRAASRSCIRRAPTDWGCDFCF